MQNVPKAQLTVKTAYTTKEELSGWFGNLSLDILSGAVVGVDLRTEATKDGSMQLTGRVTVVIPDEHLSIVVEG